MDFSKLKLNNQDAEAAQTTRKQERQDCDNNNSRGYMTARETSKNTIEMINEAPAKNKEINKINKPLSGFGLQRKSIQTESMTLIKKTAEESKNQSVLKSRPRNTVFEKTHENQNLCNVYSRL